MQPPQQSMAIKLRDSHPRQNSMGWKLPAYYLTIIERRFSSEDICPRPLRSLHRLSLTVSTHAGVGARIPRRWSRRKPGSGFLLFQVTRAGRLD